MTDTFGPVLGPMILWIPVLAILLIAFVGSKKGSRQDKKTKPSQDPTKTQENSEPAPSQNATQPVPEPVKPVEKSSGPGRRSAWFDLAVWIIALIAIFFFVRWAIPEVNEAVPAPGPSWEERQSAARAVQPPVDTASSGATGWFPIPVTQTWSSWVDVPPGYRMKLCKEGPSPDCPAIDWDQDAIELQSRARSGEILDRRAVGTTHITANRFRINKPGSLTLWYRLVPF